MVDSPEPRPLLRITPSRGWISLQLRENWAYRELLYFLTWRDIKVRYKQTALGAAWAIIQPCATMLVFSIFFGKLAHMPSDGVPYPIFTFAALVPWTFFSTAVTQSGNSLVGSANLIKKVYFPRLVIPAASVLGGLVDFAIAMLVLFVLMLYYGVHPGIAMLYLPALVLLALITALGAGLWLSAMNVRYRDVRYVIPFLVQFWMYATPIAYPSSIVPERWRPLYALNPMAGVIEGFRWGLLGTGTSPGPMVAVSTVVAILMMISGAYYFRHMERTFADEV